MVWKTCSRLNKLVTECLAIEAEGAKEAVTLAYMARAMVIATLPHSNPNSDTFQRKNGNYTLTIIANPEFGLPYGSTARLILIWLITEAKSKGSPELNIGKTLISFLKKLKMRSGGGKRGNNTRIRDQMLRLLTCTISCVYHDKKKGTCDANQFHISRSFQFWWNLSETDSKTFFSKSKIILASDFYDELIKTAIPVKFDTLYLLRKSPMQMDIYIWLTYKFFNLKKEQPISWTILKYQFGADYKNSDGLSNFKRKFIQNLTKVLSVYHEANVFPDQKGITLYPSNTHVKKNDKPVDKSFYPRCNGTEKE